MTVPRDILRVTLFALALGAVAAGIVYVSGEAPRLRAWYGLDPEHPVDVPVVVLWGDNMRVMVVVFVAAIGRDVWPRIRYAWDTAVALLLGLNVLAVAVAFAVYGEPLLRLAPGHYVLELLAIAVAAAAYLYARCEPVYASVMVWCLLASAVLLLSAAVLESRV